MTANLYLPQATYARQQSFRLFSDDRSPVLLAAVTITVPAVDSGDGDMLAINQLCRQNGAVLIQRKTTPASISCDNLALPGNGWGDWEVAIAASGDGRLVPSAVEGRSCLRILVGAYVGESPAKPGVLTSFNWRGPPESSGVKLGLYVEQSLSAVAFAPSAARASLSQLLSRRPEGRQLSWCVADAPAALAAAGDDWGLFPQVGLGVSYWGVEEQRVDVSMLVRALLYTECAAEGASRPNCLGTNSLLPNALGPLPGLSGGIASLSLDALKYWATLQLLTEQGGLDVDGDGDYDRRDLRLWLRYFAGLRGEALSSSHQDRLHGRGLVDPARFRAVVDPQQ